MPFESDRRKQSCLRSSGVGMVGCNNGGEGGTEGRGLLLN